MTACFLVAAVAIALFAIRLSLPSVFADRGYDVYGAWVMDAVQNGHWISQQDDAGNVASKPPLYIWLAALATLLSGRISMFTMLLPSALATLTTAVVIWAFGRGTFGRRPALLGALAYLVSYVGATQVGLARPDPVFALAVTAGALAAFRAWTSGQGWTWFWLAAAAATLTKGPLGVLLAGLGLLAVGWERASRRAAPVAGSHRTGVILFVLITGGWFVLAYLQLGQALIDRMIFRELVGHAVGANPEGRGWSRAFPVQPLNFLGGLAPWSAFACVGLWRTWRTPAPDPDERRAERFLFCWCVGGLLLFSLVSHQQDRHLFPIIPPAALLAGRELGRLTRTMTSRRLLGTCAGAAIAGLALIALGHHLVLDGSAKVDRALGVRDLAQTVRHRVGDGFPLTYVDTPFALQFFRSSLTPAASVEQAAALLSGPDAAFVAVRDLGALQAALGQGATRLHIVAQWPTAGPGYIRVVSNHPTLEWTTDMAVAVSPIVVRTHGVRLVGRHGRDFVLKVTGPSGLVTFSNESDQPQRVRANMIESSGPRVEERLLAPGGEWRLSVAGRDGGPATSG